MTERSLLDLRKFVAPEFVFGNGALGLAGQYASNFTAGKVLVVTDNTLNAFEWPQRVRASLKNAGIEEVVFSDISANPRDHEVMAGVDIFQETGCDAIVAVGGGSVLDCAKGIGLVSTNKKHILEFEGADMVPRPGPPLICIPTTAGSAADVSQFCIINDVGRHLKIAIVSKTTVPDISLIDPMTTTTMDEELTAHTGLDALTHAVEAYVSNASSPITDLHAKEAVRLVGRHLPQAIDDPMNLEARTGMMLASTLAGLAFSNAILGAVHAMAHSLGGLLDLPHGQCNALLLDHVIKFNFPNASERYCDLARLLGAVIPVSMPYDERLEAVLDTFKTLKKRVGVTASLGELGVKAEDLESLARNACNDPCMLTNPRRVCPEDIRQLYEQAR